MSIILASASPRRQELMKFICSNFITVPANIDETVPENISPTQTAEYLSIKKALSVCSDINSDDIVIGCDTVVIINNEVLGKPHSDTECFNMLKKLSGNTHKVITGVAVCKNNSVLVSFSESSEVEFYNLSNNEINEYIATGEPFDKCGGYGIQGFGGLLVKRICGDYFNIVGLPYARLKRVIKDITRHTAP